LVLVKIPHKKPVFGVEWLLFDSPTVAKISDLMVMGDGSADFNPNEHLDAMQELVDQIYGAFSASNSGALAADLNYNLAEGSFGDSSLLAEVDDSGVAVEFILQLGTEHRFYHLLDSAAVENFLGEKKAPATKPAPKPGKAPGVELEAEESLPRRVQFQSFGAEPSAEKESKDIDMLLDLRLPIVIELGRTTMFIKDILNLSPGSIVELDKLSGDPVDIYVNEKKFAEGEVVVIDENFGVRITELVRPEERVRKLS